MHPETFRKLTIGACVLAIVGLGAVILLTRAARRDARELSMLREQQAVRVHGYYDTEAHRMGVGDE